MISPLKLLPVGALWVALAGGSLSQGQTQYSTPAPDRAGEESLPQHAREYASVLQRLRGAEEARNQARAELEALRESLQREAQAAPERQRARAELAQTRSAYLNAYDQVLGQLRRDKEYQALRQQADQIDDQIEQLHENARSATPLRARLRAESLRQQILDLSNQKLRLADRITLMESRALADASGDKLRDDWIAARQRLERLDAEQMARINKDPAIVAAQERLADAREDLTALRARLAGAEAAYREARYQQEQERTARNPNYHTFPFSSDFPWLFPYSYQFPNYGPYMGPPPPSR